MEKTIIILLSLCLTALAQTPKKVVAVYMAGKEPTAVKGAYKVLGSELAKTITKSKEYTAADRSEAGRKIVAQEQIFQRNGAVDPKQIKKLGKQLSVDIVCIAEITEVAIGKSKSHYLEARLVDVETTEIFNSATKMSNIINGSDIVSAADAVARELVTGERKIVNYSFREIIFNPDRAIEDYTEAIRQQPNMAEYYLKRGYAYSIKKDYGKSISDYDEAIRLNPNYYEAYTQRGTAYSIKGDYDKAISDFSEAIRLNPNYTEAYWTRGFTYATKRDYDQAISDYDEAIRLNPNDASKYWMRGDVYKTKRDYDKAIADYTEAIRLNPNNGLYLSSRGYAYSLKEDYDKAISDYNEAIRQSPNGAWTYLSSRGNVYEKKGSYDKAIADHTEAIRLKSDYAMAYYNRGNVYAIKKDYSKAIADYESALRIDPNDFFAKMGLEKIKEEMK